jgi:hypothetical protein
MMKKTLPLTLRLLLVVLMGTFLSPSFGWQMVASHGESDHASVAVMADHADIHLESDGRDHDHDDVAHGQIGHLLSHLPVFIYETAPILAPAAVRNAYPVRRHTFSYADTEPPFKPPRNILFA